MMAYGRKNVFLCGWGDLRRGGAVPPGTDFYGVDRHHRRLVITDVGELDRPRCRWWPRSSRVETKRAITGRAVQFGDDPLVPTKAATVPKAPVTAAAANTTANNS